MPKVEPLSASEELFWRALMRIVITLPRHLDRDMVQAVGMTANEYTTVMSLSEAPNRAATRLLRGHGFHVVDREHGTLSWELALITPVLPTKIRVPREA